MATELLLGLPVALAGVVAGAALLVGRNRIALRFGSKPEVVASGGSLATTVIFFVGFSLVFLGTGGVLVILIRTLGGIDRVG